MKRNLLLTFAAVALALPLAGCFDFEESVNLNRDLSGTATLHMTVDMEAMVPLIADLQHTMSGQKGAPTQAELDELRQQMVSKQSDLDAKKQTDEAELAKSLPPGVKLLSSSVDQQAMKASARFQLGFDDVRKLSKITLPGNGSPMPTGAAGAGGAAPPAGGAMPYQQPFSGLSVVDEGKTWLITLVGADPATQLKAETAGTAALSDDMKKQLAALIGTARFALRLDTPFQVVETNATRKEGSTLVWEFKFGDPGAAPQTLMARLKK